MKRCRLLNNAVWRGFLAIVAICTVLVVAAGNSAAENPADQLGDADEGGSEWVIVELTLEGHRLSDSFVAMWDSASEEIWLPLGQLTEFIEFPVQIDGDPPRAQGWFLASERMIDIDFEGGAASVDGEEYELSPEQWRDEPDDIYVSSKALEQWFPLRFTFSIRTLTIDIEALEPLPIHRRLEREARLARLKAPDHHEGPRFDVVETPYQLVGTPVHDLRLESAWPSPLFGSGGGDEEGISKRAISYGNRYSLQGAGDLLWMTGRWWISGNERDPLNNARFRLERRDPGGDMLGALELTSIAIGDIHSSSSPVVSRGSSGRGFTMSSVPLERPDYFDRTTLHGEIAPGWEVELYRNGTFLEVVETDSAGQYRFVDVPLVFGWNELKMVSFGPYGEERVEFEHFLIGPGMIRAGEGYGSVYFQQEDQGLFMSTGRAGEQDSIDGLRASAKYEYGLTEDFSLSAGMTTLTLRDGQRRLYGSTGLRMVWKNLYVGAEAVGDAGHGFGAAGHFHTRLGNLNIAGSHEHAWGGFGSETLGGAATNRVGHSQLRLNGRVPGPFSIPYSLRLRNDIFDGGGHHTRLTGRYSFGVSRVRVHHSQTAYGSLDGLTGLTGDVGARFRWKQLSPRAQISYDLYPQSTVRRVSGILNWRASRELTVTSSLYSDFQNGSNFGTTAGVFTRRDRWDWGLQAGWEQNLGFSAGISLTLGVGKNPHTDKWELGSSNLTTSGAVVPRVFWDHSGTGTFDEGDEPIEGSSFLVDGATRRGATTADDGGLHLQGLRTGTYTDLGIDAAALKDPFALPSIEGRTVVARPGTATVVDFPVVQAGEIDGTVYLEHGEEARHWPGACVRIASAEEGRFSRDVSAAFDGFYYASDVPPGDYFVDLCPEALDRRGLNPPPPRRVEIKDDGTVAQGIDFVVR